MHDDDDDDDDDTPAPIISRVKEVKRIRESRVIA